MKNVPVHVVISGNTRMVLDGMLTVPSMSHAVCFSLFLYHFLLLKKCPVKMNSSYFVPFCLGNITCSNCNGCIYKGHCADYDLAGYTGPPSKEACTRYGGTGC